MALLWEVASEQTTNYLQTCHLDEQTNVEMFRHNVQLYIWEIKQQKHCTNTWQHTTQSPMKTFFFLWLNALVQTTETLQFSFLLERKHMMLKRICLSFMCKIVYLSLILWVIHGASHISSAAFFFVPYFGLVSQLLYKYYSIH